MLAALFSITSCDSSDDTETTGPVVCPTDQTTTTILNALGSLYTVSQPVGNACYGIKRS